MNIVPHCHTLTAAAIIPTNTWGRHHCVFRPLRVKSGPTGLTWKVLSAECTQEQTKTSWAADIFHIFSFSVQFLNFLTMIDHKLQKLMPRLCFKIQAYRASVKGYESFFLFTKKHETTWSQASLKSCCSWMKMNKCLPQTQATCTFIVYCRDHFSSNSVGVSGSEARLSFLI